jgi:hypothetical protein
LICVSLTTVRKMYPPAFLVGTWSATKKGTAGKLGHYKHSQ